MEYKFIYCDLLGTQKFFSSDVTVSVDSGQSKGGWFLKADSRIRDASGKVASFNSMVDALNYMGKEGWELVQAYVLTEDKQRVYHYLLKKQISSDLEGGDTDEIDESLPREVVLSEVVPSGARLLIDDLQVGEAQEAGMQRGDIILIYGGIHIHSVEELSTELVKFAGMPVELVFLRGKEVLAVSLTVGQLEAKSTSFLGIVKSGLRLVDVDEISPLK